MKNQKTKRVQGEAAVRVQRLVRQISNELFTVCAGSLNEAKGNRLAVMCGKWPEEKHLGGRNRKSVEELLTRHLANDKTEPQPPTARVGDGKDAR